MKGEAGVDWSLAHVPYPQSTFHLHSPQRLRYEDESFDAESLLDCP
jgi:hypothetical protein